MVRFFIANKHPISYCMKGVTRRYSLELITERGSTYGARGCKELLSD